jgi:outer membrane protein OmpA-like peptidoglycan-associated protein
MTRRLGQEAQQEREMTMPIRMTLLAAALLALPAAAAMAEDAETAAAQQPGAGPPPLVVHFDTGSTSIRPGDAAVLDKAARAFNEGKPLVMILTGSSDRVGGAGPNLSLSQRRATAVLNALLDRGIPADRFQILAKGETDLAVPTQKGIAEEENRRVEITWR